MSESWVQLKICGAVGGYPILHVVGCTKSWKWWINWCLVTAINSRKINMGPEFVVRWAPAPGPPMSHPKNKRLPKAGQPSYLILSPPTFPQQRTLPRYPKSCQVSSISAPLWTASWAILWNLALRRGLRAPYGIPTIRAWARPGGDGRGSLAIGGCRLQGCSRFTIPKKKGVQAPLLHMSMSLY